jgi:hypothetical protein
VTIRLTRDEVKAKYAPIADPNWTLEIETRFFEDLNERTSDKPSPAKARLLREYATDTLKAQRLSEGYIATLGAVLGKIAAAELTSTECAISQRDDRLGPRRTLRTIQAQMEASGLLVRATRTQGHGFVGEVFVYRTCAVPGHGRQPVGSLERSYRAQEGEAAYWRCLANARAEDVPY